MPEQEYLNALKKVVEYQVKSGYLALDEYVMMEIEKATGIKVIDKWCKDAEKEEINAKS